MIRRVLHWTFFVIFCCSAAWLLQDAWHNEKQTEKYRELSQELELQAMEEGKGRTRTEVQRVRTPDMVGYVKIPDTPIDYPVMQSEKENGQYYMWRDVYGERDGYGTPFLDIRCDMEKPSRNLIIYGHNMLNKTMFSALKNYRDPSYWKAHPGILLERGKVTEYYQVAAVLDLDISQESDENLFRFVDPETEEETKEYLSEISQRALYNTQVPMNPEDSYVTLVTCYRFRVGKTGRVMVVGRREYWEE